MSEEKKCNCKSCQLHKLRTEALKSDDILYVKYALTMFSNLWLNVDADLNYCEAILDGSWPSSEKILTETLKNIKEKNNG